MKSIELKRKGNHSLVAIVGDDNAISQYVCCTSYDGAKEYGSQWCWGHYFMDIANAVEYFEKEYA